MKNYELLYILPANITGAEIKTVFLEVEKNISKMGGKRLETILDHPFLTKAEVSKEEESEELKGLPIVKRKMAYYIKKNKVGFYCLFNFSSEPENVKEIENYLKMNAAILRHLIVQANPMTKEERKKLEKLFNRKRAEQEKEKIKIKKKEDKKEIEKKVEKKVEKGVEKKAEKPPESKDYKLLKKEIAEDLEKDEAKKKDEGKKEESAKKEDKKEDGGKKKKKMKLEDLEDKLDKILEDTII